MKKGFTLIELSIVLVIIGLIVGGVLVGRDLIAAAAERAQIAQIEKYNTAVNTFRGKYNALPGDLNQAVAAQFGFASRGHYAGQGDGNGLLEGNFDNTAPANSGLYVFAGEQEMFWVDLTTANGLSINLIDGGFSQDYILQPPNTIVSTAIGNFIPAAKIGGSNYVYAWSGGWQLLNAAGNVGDGINYFGIAKVWQGVSIGMPYSDMGLTVKQAYDIDKKVDDGLPQSGRVTAVFVSFNSYTWASALASQSNGSPTYALGDNTTGGPVTNPSNASGDTGDSTTCYDYITANTLPLVYSIGGNISPNNSSQVNCALSFAFQ